VTHGQKFGLTLNLNWRIIILAEVICNPFQGYFYSKSPLYGDFLFDTILFFAYTKDMNMSKIKTLEQKLDVIIDYLGIDLYKKEGFEVVERGELGFREKKRGV